MEIKVGEYVRTRDGKILKVDSFEKDKRDIECICFTNGEVYTLELLKEIMTKHNKNISDLIEVGDYVNERLVLQVDYKNKNVCLLIPLTDTTANTNIMWYGYEDIETILTKEQFEANCYKVKE